MKKLLLEEEDVALEPIELAKDDNMATSLITSLIKNAWDSVDLCNSVNITLSETDNEEIEEVINDIINSLYINIGQLENVLQNVDSQAEMIDFDEDSDLGEVVLPKDNLEVNV